MSNPDRFFVEALAVAQRFAIESDRRRRHRRRHRHRHRRVGRVLRGIALLVVLTFVVVPTLVAGGFFFGPYGLVGLLAAPLLLVITWAVVLRWTFKQPLPKPVPVALPSSGDLARLPQQTEAWIEQVRALLPWAAQTELEHITHKLVELAPQLRGLDAQSPGGVEVVRLIGEELPTLVQSFTKLPPSLSREAFYDGPSPEQKLVEGLSIIDGELGRLRGRLARTDLHALAAHQRYLELKYKRREDGLD
jgi:hypothetical protein